MIAREAFRATLGRRHPVSLGLVGLAVLGLGGLAGPTSGEAPLNNDPDTRERFEAVETLAPGTVESVDEDEDGMFELLRFGIEGGGEVHGWEDLDPDPREAELVASDPTLGAEEARTADADRDGDPEVVWAGTRGADIDGDGKSTRAEAGSIIGLADIDGDTHPEIAVADTSRSLGSFRLGSFGINPDVSEGFEGIWAGLLSEDGWGRAATPVALGDVNDDGEAEIVLRDIRTDSPLAFNRAVDVDGDGDAEILIRPPE